MLRTFQSFLSLLLTILFIQTSSAQSGNSYIPLDNPSGIQYTASELVELELAADSLVAAFPTAYQSQFKVVEGSIYPLMAYADGGVEESWMKLKMKAADTSAYYLLMVREYGKDGGVRLKTDIKLPMQSWPFNCMDESELFFLCTKLNAIDLKTSSLASVIDSVKAFVDDAKECCIAGFRSGSCGNSCSNQANIEALYQKYYFNSVEQSNIGNTGSSYTSTSTVIVKTSLKITNNPNLVSQVEQLLTVLDIQGAKAYIIDQTNLCSGDISLLQPSSTSPSLVIILDQQNSKVWFNNLDCSIWNINYVKAPSYEQLQEINLLVALYKKNYPSWYEWMALSAAYYWVCVSEPIHWMLSGAGFICDICDLVDAGIYLVEGDGKSASLSAVAVIPVVGSGLKTGIKVVSASGRKATLVFTKYGMRYFGKPAQLATIIGKETGKAAHHIIPWELFQNLEKYPAIQKLVEKGFHPNQSENGMNLWIKIKNYNWAGKVDEVAETGTSTFHGNHPAYTQLVEKGLSDLHILSGGNADDLLNAVLSQLIPNLKKQIANAEKAIKNDPAWAGKTMNDYFKTINSIL